MAGFSSQAWFSPSTKRALIVLANTERGTSVSADVVAEHVRARLDGLPPIAIADLTIPAHGGMRGWLRLFAAYVITMLAAGLFVFAVTVGLQGLAAAVAAASLFPASVVPSCSSGSSASS